ncbi:PAS domain S-box-containing protein [Methylobacterium phyllostachyos]|uniref:histidine kinase n=1 Tax=Methylobacterium phyllostachyos TaxID=582672 RepID=A0A1H0KW08_9HYPH|nr:PAS domain-containing protein [Methylobacterium phyllostachyos]SDO60055.1 PAS domain S-box-containing protein [Methylobacterium phyllostachyos]
MRERVSDLRSERDEARQREAASRVDAERIQLALSAGAIIGTWFWDLPSDRFTVDEAFATAFGLDPALGREGIPLAQIVATVHPDDQAGLSAAITDAIARGGRYAHQYRTLRADGRYRWLEANGHVEHGPDGTPLRFPGVLIDVAARRLDAALGALGERLRGLGTPEELALAAAETVGIALGLSRVAYGDIDASGSRVVIRPDWLASGQPSIAGIHEFVSYGSYIDELRRGEDVIIDDIAKDPRTAAQIENFRAIDVAALVNLPLMERGQFKAVFCLNANRPHGWTAEELNFARRVMDRTEVEIARRVAERELRATEARQRHLLKQMPGFVGVMTGPEHVFDYVNDAYVEIAGPRDYIGRTVREVFPEVEGQGFFELLDQVYTTGEPFSAKGSPVHLNGETAPRFIDHTFQPIRNDQGAVTGIFVGGYDVTEQRRMALALQDLNADLERKVTERALARGRTWQVSPDLLVVINADGRFETVNPAWTATLGWSEHELTSTPFAEFVHPNDQAATLAVWLDAVERGLPALRFQNRYRHKDGTWRWLAWVGVPDDGKVYCSAREITADKEQAAALDQAEEALRQSQKMEAVGQLTGGVAHDFNNLLTVIKSSTDLLKRPDLAEERRVRYVAAIADTVDRAAKLTGQLLAFARRQALKPEVFAACDSVRALSDMMRTLTGSRVQITTDLPAIPCFVNADASQFDTALVNLAVNARDAMNGEGKITISVSPVEAIPAIRSHPTVKSPYVAVSLSDTGTGIPDHTIERIFEPFFTTKEVGKGTGLGLSQVFGFAKQSGGDVTVESMVGEGTTFTLFLPRVPAPAQIKVADEAAALIDGQGTRVLVVEDNVAVGTFAVQTLSDLGYVPVLAVDGPAALAELARDADRFDVVFSDVMMPGMSGIELGQAIRRLYHDLPVVLTSGYSHILAQNGTYGFELLHKPYSIEQLSHILRKAASWQRRKQLLGE